MMLAFHRERGIQIRRGLGRNDDGQFYVRYCFRHNTRRHLNFHCLVRDRKLNHFQRA
jgi:hypothetical protein